MESLEYEFCNAYIPNSFERAVIISGEKIYKNLFSGISSLKEIVIADSINEIDKDSFADCKSAVLIGSAGSYAETFAKENGIQFKVIDSESDEMLLGDVNDDNIIDARDASAVLAEYANSSTSVGASFTDEQKKAADVNKDNIIDARDASDILAYYAISSVGKIDSFDDLHK